MMSVRTFVSVFQQGYHRDGLARDPERYLLPNLRESLG